MGIENRLASDERSERQKVQGPDEVRVMLELHRRGWGTRRIADELGISRNTVRRYVRAGEWRPYGGSSRSERLAGREQWLEAEFRRHRGNAEVVRQELLKQHGVEVSLRTVERAVQAHRRYLRAEAQATLRFETPPGKQQQADFGQMRIMIGQEPTKVHLCVLTLGYSRRPYVAPFRYERVEAWLQGIEGAFRQFGGVPGEVLIDNAKALVKRHNAQTREVEFSTTFHAFARYWGFQPRACAPFRAHTKGKDENGVGYVKHNAIAGHQFATWEALEGHLRWWMREIADCRVHGTTGERPIERFQREEASALATLDGRPPFVQYRELQRRVQRDLCVEVDTNHYSVPWRLIGEWVTVQVGDDDISVSHGGETVARHERVEGRRQWITDDDHFEGLTGIWGRQKAGTTAEAELGRPLHEYEAVAGGSW